MLNDVRDATAFYTVDMAKGQELSRLPGVYNYVQGAFPVVNWASFYGLPGVTPIRIRVSYRVAMSLLVHGVKPVRSDDARKEHLRGPVAVHIIIDQDGTVSQTALVSGPQLLGKDAIEAVRQWRFKPTWLNGDPVEVDTTITIQFK